MNGVRQQNDDGGAAVDTSRHKQHTSSSSVPTSDILPRVARPVALLSSRRENAAAVTCIQNQNNLFLERHAPTSMTSGVGNESDACCCDTPEVYHHDHHGGPSSKQRRGSDLISSCYSSGRVVEGWCGRQQDLFLTTTAILDNNFRPLYVGSGGDCTHDDDDVSKEPCPGNKLPIQVGHLLLPLFPAAAISTYPNNGVCLERLVDDEDQRQEPPAVLSVPPSNNWSKSVAGGGACCVGELTRSPADHRHNDAATSPPDTMMLAPGGIVSKSTDESFVEQRLLIMSSSSSSRCEEKIIPEKSSSSTNDKKDDDGKSSRHAHSRVPPSRRTALWILNHQWHALCQQQQEEGLQQQLAVAAELVNVFDG